jgi:hypothetical protein
VKKIAPYVLLVCSSCLFTPDESENFVEVDDTVNLPPMLIELSDASDTVDVFGPVEFSYEMDVLPDREYRYFFSFEEEQTPLEASSGTFTFSPFETQGYFKIALNAVTPSGTGSLADKYGAELVVFRREWVARVDTKPPDLVTITSISPDNGSLRIDWPHYSRANFKSYTITKYRQNEYGEYDFANEITDQDSNFFYDSSFVGGAAYYIVKIKTLLHEGDGEAKTYADNNLAGVHHAEHVHGTTMNVVIRKSKYYANVSKVAVQEVVGNLTTPKGQSVNALDTVFQIESVFGAPRELRVRTHAKSFIPELAETDATNSATAPFVVGEAIPPFTNILFAPAHGKYFTYNGTTTIALQSYSFENNEDLGTTTLPHGISETAVITPDQSTLAIIDNNDVYLYDVSSLSLLHHVDVSSLVTLPDRFIGVGVDGPNTLLLLKVTDPNGQSASLVIYDLLTSTLIGEYTRATLGRKIWLSPDKQYVAAVGGYASVKKFDGTNMLSHVWIDVSQSAFVDFDLSNANQMYHFSYARVNQVDLNTSAVTGGFNLPFTTLMSLDTERHWLFGRIGGTPEFALVYDYQTQTEVLKIEAKFTEGVNIFHFMSGGYIFSSQGARLRISQ